VLIMNSDMYAYAMAGGVLDSKGDAGYNIIFGAVCVVYVIGFVCATIAINKLKKRDSAIQATS